MGSIGFRGGLGLKMGSSGFKAGLRGVLLEFRWV